MLLSLEHRGNDASGVSMQARDGQIFTHKNDEGAWRFVGSNGYRKFLADYLTDDIEQVILHTRAASKGNPRFNKNNHPLEAGKAAIVHNGNIYNDDELFKDLKLERNAETDSDLIRAIVDEEGLTKKAIERLGRMRGSAAIACLHPAYPGRMIIGRSGSPMVVGTTEDFLYFASVRNAIHRAARPHIKRFGIDAFFLSLDIAFSPMANDTAWLLGPDGKEWHQEFKTLLGNYVAPDYRHLSTRFTDRQTKWTKEAKHRTPSTKKAIEVEVGRFMKCENCGLDIHIMPHQINRPLSELHCPDEQGASGCGFPLSYKKPKGVLTN